MGAEWDMWGQEGDPAVETHGPMKGNLSGGDTHTHTHTHTPSVGGSGEAERTVADAVNIFVFFCLF